MTLVSTADTPASWVQWVFERNRVRALREDTVFGDDISAQQRMAAMAIILREGAGIAVHRYTKDLSVASTDVHLVDRVFALCLEDGQVFGFQGERSWEAIVSNYVYRSTIRESSAKPQKCSEWDDWRLIQLLPPYASIAAQVWIRTEASELSRLRLSGQTAPSSCVPKAPRL